MLHGEVSLHQFAYHESYTLYYEDLIVHIHIEIQSMMLFPMVRSHFHIQMVSFHIFSTDVENVIGRASL